MVPNKTVDPFIIGDSILRAELHHNFLVTILLNCTLSLAESENVVRVSVELILSL